MLPSISFIIMTLTFWLNLTTTVPRRQLEKSEEGTVQGKFQHVMGQQMPLGQSRISHALRLSCGAMLMEHRIFDVTNE